MKKIILFSMLLIMSASSFSQQTNPSPALTKQDYLQKSKKQKTAAWILLGGGTAMAVTGLIVWSNGVNNETDPFGALVKAYTGPGIIIFGVGLCAAVGSIPLFIASGKNKRRAMSVSFKNEPAPQLQKNSFVYRSVPSLSLKISL